MSTTTFEGFSISHAAILDGTTGLEESWGDIYGVNEGTLEPDIDNYDNEGDDTVMSTWYWFNFATVTIQAGYVPFSLIANLSGSTITSSGSAPDDHYSVPLWEEAALNQPARPMLIRIPSRDSAGVIRVMDFILYKVQFEPFSFDGPSYKDGLKLNYSGKALMASVDETGAALSKRAIGRMVNKPAT